MTWRTTPARERIWRRSVGRPGGRAEAEARAELLRLSARPDAPGGPAAARVDDRERLRSLGYVNFAPAKPGAAAPDPKDKIGLLKLIQQAQAFEAGGKFRRRREGLSRDRGGHPRLAGKLCQPGPRPSAAEQVRPGHRDPGPGARPHPGFRGPPRPARPHLSGRREAARGPGDDGQGPGPGSPERRCPDRRRRHPGRDGPEGPRPGLTTSAPWSSSRKAAT